MSASTGSELACCCDQVRLPWGSAEAAALCLFKRPAASLFAGRARDALFEATAALLPRREAGEKASGASPCRPPGNNGKFKDSARPSPVFFILFDLPLCWCRKTAFAADPDAASVNPTGDHVQDPRRGAAHFAELCPPPASLFGRTSSNRELQTRLIGQAVLQMAAPAGGRCPRGGRDRAAACQCNAGRLRVRPRSKAAAVEARHRRPTRHRFVQSMPAESSIQPSVREERRLSSRVNLPRVLAMSRMPFPLATFYPHWLVFPSERPLEVTPALSQAPVRALAAVDAEDRESYASGLACGPGREIRKRKYEGVYREERVRGQSESIINNALEARRRHLSTCWRGLHGLRGVVWPAQTPST
ncbi:hypothetical protein MRX96_001886 [Rhipicephalus microplus]